MKRTLLTCVLMMALGVVWAQGPNNSGTYYRSANGLKGRALKTKLSGIIENPRNVGYTGLYEAYKKTDTRPDGYVRDWYSNVTNFRHGIDNKGSYSKEGDMYNREHSVPQSWFSGSGIKSDIVHVLPTDGYVNNRRSNYPFGEVKSATYTSANGYSKLGSCATEGYSGTVFEPNDEIKGDIARIYFYMVMCYEPGFATWDVLRDPESKTKLGEILADGSKHCGTWTCDMFNTADTEEGTDAYQPFAPWAFDMLIRWAKEDPVSQKEIDRNNAIWQLQGNRNPFVDYPGLEDYIWGEKKDVAFDYGGELPEEPTSDNCEVALNKTTLGVDWSATDNLRSYWTRTPIIFEKNGITFTYSYGMEGSKLYADDNELRLYNYNTLTLTAHNNEITEVEFTIPGRNHDNKTLVASVGEVNNNIWTGNTQEVTFASNYVSSTKAGGVSYYYYLGISNVKVTVANPTGIEQLKTERLNDNRIFNIVGVQMDENQLNAGVYIKNGRKVVIR